MSSLKLKHSGGNSVSLNPPTSAPTSSEVAFKLPTSDGTANQVLKTDGSGNLGWIDNTPMWLVKLSSNYSHTSTNTWVTAPLASEAFDTDSAFDTSNYKFTVPTGKGGKYFLYYHQQIGDNPDDGENMQSRIDKNGTPLPYSYGIALSPGTNKTTTIHHSFVTDLVAGDELTMHLYHHAGETVSYNESSTYFGGYRLIGGQ